MAWSRTSRHERGYGTAWDKLRLSVLKRDAYLCQCPDCLGGTKRVTPASEVDHIKPKAHGGTDDPDNLRAVNRMCHVKLRAIQFGHALKPEVGADGWPVKQG